jgi:hypothetical protein
MSHRSFPSFFSEKRCGCPIVLSFSIVLSSYYIQAVSGLGRTVSLIRFPVVCSVPGCCLEPTVPQVMDLVEAVENLLVVGDRQDGRLLFAGHLAQQVHDDSCAL